jgi:glutathionylspermidine synthase
VQWQWLQDLGMPDQFNFIHEQLIEHWESIKAHYGADKTYYFTGMPTREDWSTVVYLQETATEAGLIASAMDITDVALADTDWSFLDARNKNDIKPIDVMFKLYPWEYFAQDNFFKGVAVSQTKWLEPAWKLVTSSKGLLAKMYEMFPDSPWLIPTRLATAAEKLTLEGLQNVVIKPCLSREGSGVIIVKGKEVIRSTNDNANNSAASVVQHLCPTLQTADGSIIAGVWVIGGVTCGMGLRLDGDITGDLARFIPHFFI